MERDALHILPEEVWNIVLDYLVTGRDMRNANNVCHVWREVMKKHVFTWLFDKCVVQLTHILSKDELLNVRRVCKLWKNSIDKYLRSKRLNLQYSSIYSHPANYMPLVEMNLSQARQRYRQNTSRVLQSFHRDFNHHPNNPFVSRAVHLGIDGLGFGLVPFFEKFGHHIWYLTITIYQLFDVRPETNKLSSPADIAKFLWKVLECTPNLKTLKLTIRQNSQEQRYYDFLNCPAQIAKLKEFLESNRAPQLPNLLNLEATVDEHLWPIQETLQNAYASQLKYYTQIQLEGLGHAVVLPNLKQFCWSISVISLNVLDPAIMDNLKKFPNISKLCLDVETHHWFNTDCYGVCPTSVMQGIEKYTNKVKNLSIVWTTLIYDFPFKFDMPLLEKLTLQFGGELFAKWSFSFLKFLPKLKHLQLQFQWYDYEKLRQMDWRQCSNSPKQCPHNQAKYQVDNDDDHRIDILHCLDGFDTFSKTDLLAVSNVYKSNIWKQVTSLQKLTVAIVERTFDGLDHNQRVESSKQVRVYGRKLAEGQ